MRPLFSCLGRFRLRRLVKEPLPNGGRYCPQTSRVQTAKKENDNIITVSGKI
jgi:hypothetical protein